LIAVTFTASWAKMFNANPLIGLLAHARMLAASPATADIARRIFNDRLDAAVCGGLIVLVSIIVIESATVWVSVISGRRVAQTHESEFVATRYTADEMA
jgi:carbon starvation protein